MFAKLSKTRLDLDGVPIAQFVVILTENLNGKFNVLLASVVCQINFLSFDNIYLISIGSVLN